MEYATMTFWLVVIVFTALGVHRLWSSLIQPKVVNFILLPGTLVAQLGHVLGLLVTGSTVNNTTLIKSDDSGEPETGDDPKPRIPVVGTVLIALLPMAGCAAAIYWTARYLGSDLLADMTGLSVRNVSLPTSMPKFFALLRGTIDLVEELVVAVATSNLTDWRSLLFLYLVICLTVRMAPLTGNVRGALGAIAIGGLIAFLFGELVSSTGGPLDSVWPLITFSAAILICLLVVSLVIKAVVSLAQTFSTRS